MSPFFMSFEVRWSDVDANFHVRHSVYADFCATARLAFLAQQGFGMKDFAAAEIGPVLFKETLQYLREIPPEDRVRVSLKLAGHSDDGRKFRLRHELWRESDGVRVAEVEVDGAWMSTKLRKVVAPPEKLKTVLGALERTEDFTTL